MENEMLRIVASLALAMVPTLLNAQDSTSHEGSYYCKAQASGGVKWKGSAWEGVTFNISESDFVLKVVAADITGTDIAQKLEKGSHLYVITVGSTGDHGFEDFCENSGGSKYLRGAAVVPASGDLECSTLSINEYKFSFKTQRYLHFYSVGYVDGADDVANTPSITIGKCMKVK